MKDITQMVKDGLVKWAGKDITKSDVDAWRNAFPHASLDEAPMWLQEYYKAQAEAELLMEGVLKFGTCETCGKQNAGLAKLDNGKWSCCE